MHYISVIQFCCTQISLVVYCEKRGMGMEEKQIPHDGEAIRKALRENLRKFRTEARYSQQDVAQILGINRATYTYYETGKTIPSIVDLWVLARLYHRPLEEFLQ